jgi:hypothetical protein
MLFNNLGGNPATAPGIFLDREEAVKLATLAIGLEVQQLIGTPGGDLAGLKGLSDFRTCPSENSIDAFSLSGTKHGKRAPGN